MFFDRSLFFDFSEEQQLKVKIEDIGKVSPLLLDKDGENEEAVLWRPRLGHNHFKNVKRLAHHVSGMNLKNSAFDELFCCEVCTISKSRWQPVSQKKEQGKSSKLDLVFTDIFGPMLTISLGGKRYAISLRIASAGTQRYISSNRRRSA